MPLHKHEPVPEKDMYHVSKQNTVCETLRDIYFEADRIGNEDIKLKARIATAMAKAMDRKLREYNPNWVDDFFDPNPDMREKAYDLWETLKERGTHDCP